MAEKNLRLSARPPLCLPSPRRGAALALLAYYICFFIMASKSIAIAQRSQLRANITRIYNDTANFSTYDSLRVSQLKTKLENIAGEISILNEKILNEKFSVNYVEEEVQKELLDIDAYKDKLIE